MSADGTLTAGSSRWFRQTPLAARCSAYTTCSCEECDMSHASNGVLIRARGVSTSCRMRCRLLARPCRLGRCSKSAAIWGTPVVLLRSSVGQPVTRFGHLDLYRNMSAVGLAFDDVMVTFYQRLPGLPEGAARAGSPSTLSIRRFPHCSYGVISWPRK